MKENTKDQEKGRSRYKHIDRDRDRNKDRERSREKHSEGGKTKERDKDREKRKIKEHERDGAYKREIDKDSDRNKNKEKDRHEVQKEGIDNVKEYNPTPLLQVPAKQPEHRIIQLKQPQMNQSLQSPSQQQQSADFSSGIILNGENSGIILNSGNVQLPNNVTVIKGRGSKSSQRMRSETEVSFFIVKDRRSSRNK
ncbi:MAG: hypothetical protein EZS28_000511 [Streblomastix strix]|uniref:Uncharacterized protein n=1 Tax=Streblomastix strix TaxID=222440 RepID=A0A5J4XBR2_9EUKA|nr:MAG: hypothetical protein EZS28_000511 [Streblomastix strix]